MSALPSGPPIAIPELISLAEPFVTMGPAEHRGLARPPRQPRPMAPPSRDDRQVVLPTQKRRRHGQGLITEDVAVVIRHFPAGARGKKAEPATEPIAPAASARRARRLVVPEPVDNGPTPERCSHMAARDRTGRAVDLVERMYRHGQIDDDERAAANRWHRDYVTGLLGAVDPEENRTSTGADAHDVQLSRVAAVNRCRAVRMALGLCGEVRLIMLLVEELGYAAMAKRLFPGQADGERRIKAELLFLLVQLKQHYVEADRQVRAAGRRDQDRG